MSISGSRSRVLRFLRRSHASMGQDAGAARDERRPEGLSGSMRVSGVLVVLGLLGGAFAGCAGHQAAWREFVSPHFVLHTDVKRAQARETLTQLERSFD